MFVNARINKIWSVTAKVKIKYNVRSFTKTNKQQQGQQQKINKNNCSCF